MGASAQPRNNANSGVENVDAYLATLPDQQRAALQKLRQTIRSAAPEATELISYGLPTFKYQKRPLIYYGAAKNHCAIYGGSIDSFRDEFAEFDTSKGTVRFSPDRPVPASLVRKMLKVRIKEIETGADGYRNQTVKKNREVNRHADKEGNDGKRR